MPKRHWPPARDLRGVYTSRAQPSVKLMECTMSRIIFTAVRLRGSAAAFAQTTPPMSNNTMAPSSSMSNGSMGHDPKGER